MRKISHWTRSAAMVLPVALSVAVLASPSRADVLDTQSTAQVESVIQKTLANGIKVIVKPEPESTLVAIDAFVRVSTDDESTRDAGIASFVARTLLASTASDTPEHMLSDINDLGGSVSVTHETDYIELNALTVKDKFANALFLVSDVLENADFDPTSVELARSDMLSEIDLEDSSVFSSGYNALKHSIYGNSGPAASVVGSRSSIERIRQSDLVRFHRKLFVPANITLVIVGNVDPDDAVSKISTYLEDMASGSRHPAAQRIPPVKQASAIPTRNEIPNLAEVGVMVGYEAAPEQSDDYPALLVAQTLLGGMKSSLMFTNIREKEGLAYALGSFYNARHDSGEVVGYALAAPNHEDRATKASVPSVPILKKLIEQQFDALKTVPMSEADVHRAEHFLIGSYKVKHERIEQRASLLGAASINSGHGADFDIHFSTYVASVTPADVMRVAKKYFKVPSVSIIEPATKVAPLHMD